MVPFYAVGVLRADALWREVGIPFEPYVKAGLGYALWRASNTLGTSNYDGVSGTGQSFGTFLAAGLGFNLNVFDRYAAQNFDDAMGINATYLFVEGTREDLSGLGFQKDPLRVGSTNWTFGLNLEF
jgi:opacity protein-like surface antigen